MESNLVAEDEGLNLKLERCTLETLEKYNLKKEVIIESSTRAFWDDSGMLYYIPFNLDQEKRQMNSLFAQMMNVYQNQYTNYSLQTHSKSNSNYSNSLKMELNHPFTASFLCFQNKTYVGTISVCEPVSCETDCTGFHDIEEYSEYQKLFYNTIKKYHFRAWIVYYTIYIWEYNKQILFDPIMKNYLKNGVFLIELFSVDPKFHKQGIGTWLLQTTLKKYIVNATNKINQKNKNKNKNKNTQTQTCDGFVMLTTGASKHFYQKNGFKVITTITLPGVRNESGEWINATYSLCLWHQNSKILDAKIKEIRKIIKEETKGKTMIECIQILFFPTWLQWIPIDLNFIFCLITLILAVIIYFVYKMI